MSKPYKQSKKGKNSKAQGGLKKHLNKQVLKDKSEISQLNFQSDGAKNINKEEFENVSAQKVINLFEQMKDPGLLKQKPFDLEDEKQEKPKDLVEDLNIEKDQNCNVDEVVETEESISNVNKLQITDPAISDFEELVVRDSSEKNEKLLEPTSTANEKVQISDFKEIINDLLKNSPQISDETENYEEENIHRKSIEQIDKLISQLRLGNPLENKSIEFSEPEDITDEQRNEENIITENSTTTIEHRTDIDTQETQTTTVSEVAHDNSESHYQSVELEVESKELQETKTTTVSESINDSLPSTQSIEFENERIENLQYEIENVSFESKESILIPELHSSNTNLQDSDANSEHSQVSLLTKSEGESRESNYSEVSNICSKPSKIEEALKSNLEETKKIFRPRPNRNCVRRKTIVIQSLSDLSMEPVVVDNFATELQTPESDYESRHQIWADIERRRIESELIERAKHVSTTQISQNRVVNVIYREEEEKSSGSWFNSLINFFYCC